MGGQRSCTKHASGLVSNMLPLGEKGGSCGWTEVVCEACFRVSLKHASLWAEIFKKVRLKGLLSLLPTVFCGQLQPYRLQEKGVAFGFAGSPCFFTKHH